MTILSPLCLISAAVGFMVVAEFEAACDASDESCAAASAQQDSDMIEDHTTSLLQAKLGSVSKHSAGAFANSSGCPPRRGFPPAPTSALQHNGISWPDMCIPQATNLHFFIMGDYGGITCGDAATLGNGGDPNSWTCHGRQGLYAKTADNTADKPGRYLSGSDYNAQSLVAAEMVKRARISKPDYVLSGGDNFYFGGIDLKCGHPMNQIHPRTKLQFQVVFEDMYRGVDVPFFSVMGNHDYGGRSFTAAWDQQIAYTWGAGTSKRFILPGLYWRQHVDYPAGGFSVDYFMVDTNKGDAHPWQVDPNHNICGKFNHPSASCAKMGGPDNRINCHQWFDKIWREQSAWLNKGLAESKAQWKIIVTHFPPSQFMRGYWIDMHRKYGIDLLVTSHKHDQELHLNDGGYGGMSWLIAGGGGGITSEQQPGQHGRGKSQYGFMDVTITKDEMKIESINEHGYLHETRTTRRKSEHR